MTAEFDPTDIDGGGGGEAGGGDRDPYGIEGDFNDEDADIAGDPTSLRDALLFVIDCQDPNALQSLRPGSRSMVQEALAAAVDVLKTKVVTPPDEKVGVLLFGVRNRSIYFQR